MVEDFSGGFHCTSCVLLLVTAADSVNTPSPQPVPEVNFDCRGRKVVRLAAIQAQGSRGKLVCANSEEKKKKKVLHQTESGTAGQARRLRGLGDLNPENFYLRSRGAASTPPSLTQPQGAMEGLQPFMTHKRLFGIILKIEIWGVKGDEHQ